MRYNAMRTTRRRRPWQARPRWRVRHGTEIAIGPGKADLLEAIEETGSISAAARDLEMSYRRAWLLVATMNRCFQEPLVATSRRRRAGASLTARGKQVIKLYRAIEACSLRSTQALSISLLRMLKP